MCRMMAAVGEFDVAALAAALRAMAANANAEYDHELRSEGTELQHDCGWGVAYRAGGGLVRRRSAASCLADPAFGELAGLETDLLMLHARRTPDRGTIALENSHPFVAERAGTSWAFCHNGAVEDVTQLGAPGLPAGAIDSELLFHHILDRLDVEQPARSLVDTLGRIRDFTCLNCFLGTPDEIVAHARMAAGTSRPRYYTLWRGRGAGFTIVSSEPFDRPAIEWSPVPDGTAFILGS